MIFKRKSSNDGETKARQAAYGTGLTLYRVPDLRGGYSVSLLLGDGEAPATPALLFGDRVRDDLLPVLVRKCVLKFGLSADRRLPPLDLAQLRQRLVEQRRLERADYMTVRPGEFPPEVVDPYLTRDEPEIHMEMADRSRVNFNSLVDPFCGRNPR